MGINLKIIAMSSEKDTPEYKFYIKKFDGGSPAEGVALVKGLKEIWSQNGMNVPNDQIATIRAIVRK